MLSKDFPLDVGTIFGGGCTPSACYANEGTLRHLILSLLCWTLNTATKRKVQSSNEVNIDIFLNKILDT